MFKNLLSVVNEFKLVSLYRSLFAASHSTKMCSHRSVLPTYDDNHILFALVAVGARDKCFCSAQVARNVRH